MSPKSSLVSKVFLGHLSSYPKYKIHQVMILDIGDYHTSEAFWHAARDALHYPQIQIPTL